MPGWSQRVATLFLFAIATAPCLTAQATGFDNCLLELERGYDGQQSQEAPEACKAWLADRGAEVRLPTGFSSQQALALEQWLNRSAERNTRAPNPALVPDVLASLQRESDEPEALSYFQRFLEWISRLENQSGEEEAPPWLKKLVGYLEAITPDMIRVAALALLALLLGALGWVLIRELRAGRNIAPAHRQQDDYETATYEFDDDHLMPDGGSDPAALLRQIIRYLIKKGDLPDDRSLTNGELRQWLQRRQPDHARMFDDVVRAAELQIYGGQAMDAGDAAGLARQARTLLAEQPQS